MVNTPLPELTWAGIIASSLPTPGRIVYNGYEFPVAHRKRLRARPIKDRAGMAHKGNEWTLSVVFFLSADTESELAAQLQDYSTPGENTGLRNKLTQPGRTLIVQDCGFGNLTIDPGTSGTRDLSWGPTPEDLDFRFIGNLCVEVTWVCKFTIADCLNIEDGTGIVKLENNLTAFNMDVEFVLGAEGLTERVLTGYLEVPQMRGDDNSPVRDVEEFYNQSLFPLPPGFRRLQQGRRLSADRSRIDFRIVDVEIPGDDALPNGIVDGAMRMTVENREPSNFVTWTYTLEGSFVTRRGADRAFAYNSAWFLLGQYVNRLRGLLVTTKRSLVPEFVKISRDLFSRRTDFSFSFLVAMEIQEILSASGIFEPVPGTNWQQWATSMQELWQPRGIAQLSADPRAESIVNICSGGGPPEPGDDARIDYGTQATLPIFDCSQISAVNSWIDYDNRLVGEVVSYASTHAVSDDVRLDISDTSADFTRQGNAELGHYSRDSELVLQTHGPPICRVLMIGSARRVQFKPLIPALESVDGQPVVELDRKVSTRPAGSFGSCKIWRSEWRILYQVMQLPSADVKLAPDQPSPHDEE